MWNNLKPILSTLIIIICLNSCQKKCVGICDLNTPNEIKSGIPKFKAYLKKHPKNPSTYSNLGMCYCKLSNYNQAILYFDTLILIDSKFVGAYSNRGMCKSLLNDKEGSCADFVMSVKQGQNERVMGNQTLSEYIATHCKN